MCSTELEFSTTEWLHGQNIIGYCISKLKNFQVAKITEDNCTSYGNNEKRETS